MQEEPADEPSPTLDTQRHRQEPSGEPRPDHRFLSKVSGGMVCWAAMDEWNSRHITYVLQCISV